MLKLRHLGLHLGGKGGAVEALETLGDARATHDRAQEPPIRWMVDLGGALDGELGWLLGILILGHVAMVGVHESMWRDGTLARMLDRKRASV